MDDQTPSTEENREMWLKATHSFLLVKCIM